MSPKIRRHRHIAFGLLFLVMMLVGISNSMLFVVLPYLTRQLGAGEMYIGLIFAGSSLLYMFFSPFWGWRSDVSGRRPVLLIGILGNGFSLLAMGLVSAWIGSGAATAAIALLLLALSRAIYGLVGSSMQPAAQAYIVDRTDRTERTTALSLLAAGAGLGTVIGPPLAAWLSSGFGVANAIYVLVALSVVFFATVSIGLPERRKPMARRLSGSALLDLIVDPRLRILLVIGALSWMGQGVFLQTLLFFLSDRLQATASEVLPISGTILASGAISVLVLQFGLIPVLKPSPKQLMVAGAALAAFGSGLMIFVSSVWVIGLAFLLAASGFGLLRPGISSAASLRVRDHEQGGAAGLIGATAGAGFLLAPFTGLALYQFIGPFAPFALLSVTLSLALLLAIFQPIDQNSD